jgi:hypothetical protein
MALNNKIFSPLEWIFQLAPKLRKKFFFFFFLLCAPSLSLKSHVTVMCTEHCKRYEELTKLLACKWYQVVEVSVFQCNFERETYLWDIL